MKTLLIWLMFLSFTANAQPVSNFAGTKTLIFSDAVIAQPVLFNGHRKLFQRNTGMIIGVQRGKYTSIELGGEAHWRKISLLKPHIIGATANLSYNLGNNVLGYHAGIWKKQGHINLTYGADVSYFTDFNNRRSFGIGPSVGFRFFGLHLVNGFTFLTNNYSKGEVAPLPVNTFYMSLRYYFPVKNEFTWDRQTMKKKRARKKERLRRKEKNQNEHTKKWNIFGATL
jgi:hypothetical protein